MKTLFSIFFLLLMCSPITYASTTPINLELPSKIVFSCSMPGIGAACSPEAMFITNIQEDRSDLEIVITNESTPLPTPTNNSVTLKNAQFEDRLLIYLDHKYDYDFNGPEVDFIYLSEGDNTILITVKRNGVVLYSRKVIVSSTIEWCT